MSLWNFFSSLDFTVIAIISAFFGGISNVLARVLLKNVPSRHIVGVSFSMMGLTMLVLAPLFYQFSATWQAMRLLFAIAVIDSVANYFYFKTFERTEASTATPILSLAPAVTFVGAWMFLDDKVSVFAVVIALMLIVAIVFFSSEATSFKAFRKDSLEPAIMASLCFGISAIPTKMILSSGDLINPPTLYMFRAMIVGMLAFIMMRPNLHSVAPKHLILAWVRGLFVIVTWVLLYYALSKGHAGIAVTLANTTPVFVILLSVVFLREKITMRKVLAVATVFALSALIVYT